jgi:hypothetical protein
VVADSLGNITSTWIVPFDQDEPGATLLLTATGQISGLKAQTEFTDGAAKDGDGTMTVSLVPASICSNSTGNSFTFTFKEGSGNQSPSNSVATIQIPAGWTVPQSSNSSNSGYVSVTADPSLLSHYSTVSVPFSHLIKNNFLFSK